MKDACDQSKQFTGGVVGVIIDLEGLTQQQIISQLAAEIAASLGVDPDKIQLISIIGTDGGKIQVEVDIVTDTTIESTDLANKIINIIRNQGSGSHSSVLSHATDAQLSSRRTDVMSIASSSTLISMFSLIMMMILFNGKF